MDLSQIVENISYIHEKIEPFSMVSDDVKDKNKISGNDYLKNHYDPKPYPFYKTMPNKTVADKIIRYGAYLYGVMYKPFKMEEGRKYPVISYVYPGPQTESVPYRFTTTGGKNIALAQLGFVVVNFGHRGGSPQRNNYYHTYGYNNLRDYALEDDKYGLEQLADRYNFINLDKVGIYGHSGGGFMSTAAILSYPDFYDVAVSSAGNHDNNIYNQYWSESHNGIEEIKKILKKSDTTDVKTDSVKVSFKSKVPKNQDLAKNLKGHLLLVHGDVDNNVHPANTIRLADALIKSNKRFDFMVFPGKRHGYGNYQSYFERMMMLYFSEHLLGDYRSDIEIYEIIKKD